MKRLRMLSLAAIVLLLGCLTACTVGLCDVCGQVVIGKNYSDGSVETLCRDCRAMQKRMAYYGGEGGGDMDTPEPGKAAADRESEDKPRSDVFSIPQRKFSKPEMAGKFFIESVSNLDFTSAVSAFSICDRAEGTDFDVFTNRQLIFMPSELLPDYPEYVPLDELYFLQNAARSMKSFLYTLLTDYRVGEAYIVDGENLTLEDISGEMDPSRLSSLKCLRIDYSNPALQNSADHEKNMQEVCKLYGADSIEEYVMLLELEDSLYAAGFTAIEYDGKWQIMNLTGTMAGLAVDSTEETTMEDYMAYLE